MTTQSSEISTCYNLQQLSKFNFVNILCVFFFVVLCCIYNLFKVTAEHVDTAKQQHNREQFIQQ